LSFFALRVDRPVDYAENTTVELVNAKEINMNENTHTLDARGLSCPLPILRTKKAIAGMQEGEILEVTATDPGSVKDLDSYCSQTGNQMLSSQETDGEFHFRIRKV
jgi:tRNA 2-thiouridine synthesizing protein A